MELEVQLAGPHRQVGVGRFRFRRGPELGRPGELDARRPLEIGQPVGRLQHVPGWSTAAVPVAEEVQRTGGNSMVAELAGRVRQLVHGEVAVVGVGRWEVGEHPAAVNALPPERVVGHAVDAVPRQLLGQKSAHTGQPHDLRKRGRIPEHIGQPDLVGLDAELVQEETFAVHDLAHQRFAGRHVAIGLDPHAADRHELTGCHLLAQPLPQRRVVLLDPRQLHRLRAREAVVRMVVHQPQGGREGAGALPSGFPQGPQPGGVDVGVADRAEHVGTGVGRLAQCSGQRQPGFVGGAGDVLGIDGVARRVEGPQHVGRPPALGLRHCYVLIEIQQDVHVVVEAVDVRVEHCDLGPVEAVQRRAAVVRGQQWRRR